MLKRNAGRAPVDSPPDLQTQYEELLDAVWRCEREWNLDQQLDLAIQVQRAQMLARAQKNQRRHAQF